MTVGQLTAHLRSRLLPVFGQGETQAMVRLIFKHLKGWGAVQMFTHEGDEASDYLQQKAGEIADRLLTGEPIQYITGIAEFAGIDFAVDRRVLIPRPETQQLTDMIADRYSGRPDLRVLDLCTGSGCIALTLARALPFAQVEAIDISADAIDVAKANAQRLKANIAWHVADVYEYRPEAEAFDIIVSNPPYIDPDEADAMEPTVLDYEPHGALFVADAADPVAIYRSIAAIAREGLKPGGTLWLEVNPRHAREVADAVRAALGESDVVKDIHGRDRFVTGIKSEP